MQDNNDKLRDSSGQTTSANNIMKQNFSGKLIQALNQASFFLLNSDVKTFEGQLFKAMGTMANVVEVDRMYIWQNSIIDGKLYCSQIYEWSEETEPIQNSEYAMSVSYDDVMTGLEKQLSSDVCLNAIVSDMVPEHQEHLIPQGIKSILMVPVFIDDKFWGFVGFDDCHNERTFTETEETILRSSSLLFAHAYHRNEQEYKIAEQNEFNRIMFDKSPIGLTIFDDGMNVIDCNDSILEMLKVSKEYYINHFFDLTPEYQLNGMKSLDTVQEKHRLALNGENQKFEWTHILEDGSLLPTEASLESMQLRGKNVILAFAYDLSKIRKLEMKIESLETKIYTDPLTGINNRRFFDEQLKRVMKTLSRSGSDLSLMIIDIDQFKKYNDNYGHPEGDVCLKKIAEVLSNSVGREGDFVARYGGEEFVAVLPYTSEEGACVVAETILRNIRDANIPHEASDVADHVTLSIGVVNGKVDHSQTGENYIKLADNMLYVSKYQGRNRYTFDKIEGIKSKVISSVVL